MKNKTKIILISLGVLLFMGITFLVTYKILDYNKVVAIITMDINPSIEVNVNKDNKVLKVKSLNDDGKEILTNLKLKCKDLESSINNINKKLIKEKYLTNENNIVLINVSNKNLESKVVETINTSLKSNNIEAKVIFQEINESAKKKAESYGISASKASYIEDLIKENNEVELNYEELKDKSIKEIDAFVKEEVENKKIEEQKKLQEEQKKAEEAKKAEDAAKKKAESTTPRKGSIAKCQNLKSNITNDDAFKKTLDDLNLPYKIGYNYQTIASIYGDTCAYETQLIYNKVKYTYYHNFVTNALVHKESTSYLAGELEPVMEIIRAYFAKTYGADPSEVQHRTGGGGIFSDVNTSCTVEYKAESYKFVIVRKTAVIKSVTKV